MIKAKAGNKVILGLSRNNLEKLQEGKPIRVLGKQLGIEYDLFIFFGETEESMAKDLRPFISAQETRIEDNRPN